MVEAMWDKFKRRLDTFSDLLSVAQWLWEQLLKGAALAAASVLMTWLLRV